MKWRYELGYGKNVLGEAVRGLMNVIFLKKLISFGFFLKMRRLAIWAEVILNWHLLSILFWPEVISFGLSLIELAIQSGQS